MIGSYSERENHRKFIDQMRQELYSEQERRWEAGHHDRRSDVVYRKTDDDDESE